MNFRRVVGIFSVVSTIMSFYACGDDKSSSANSLPDEVADKAELETYECNMSVIGGKVFVKSLGKNYECDGEEWFESYDQPKSSAKGKSSSSSKGNSSSFGKSSSSSSEKVSSSSSSAVEQSSSSVMSSSSRPTEILEPETKVNERCSETGACDAMDKNDVGTWHFVRKDDFGDDAEYTYKADGRDLIVTIKSADGSVDSKTYSMYNMESEVGVEMAFNAAKSTCKDGGGNDKKIKTCVKDTTKVFPPCDREHEGYLALIDSVYQICKSNSWTKATALEYDTYGLECFDDGRLVKGKVNAEAKYVCDSGFYRTATKEELDYGLACIIGNENAIVEYADSVLKKCRGQKWVNVSLFDYNTYKQECGKKNLGQVIVGRKLDRVEEEWYNRYYCTADGWVDITYWSWDIPKGVRFNPNIDYQLMTDSRDGQVYKTVTIGSQTWMAENLNYADPRKTPNGKGYSMCFFDDSSKCDVAGRFYIFEAIEKNSEFPLCPSGWHLPDTTEWRTLFDFVASVKPEGVQGNYFCSQSGWDVRMFAKGCTDDFGFSALPMVWQSILYEFNEEHRLDGSYRSVYVEDPHTFAHFWTSTIKTTIIENDQTCYYASFQNSTTIPYFVDDNRWSMNATPIRCVKDE